MPNQTTSLALAEDQNALQPLQEFNTDAAMIRAMKEVEGAFIIAQRFKRNEDEAYQSIMRACKRTTFAERAEYKYPRGKKLNEETGKWEDNIISGPSVYLSREMIRVWGNVQVGTEIVRDTDDERHIRSYALDLQTNVRRFAETTFRKLIQRKKKEKDSKTGKLKDIYPPVTEWVRPDERDLRELHNKHAAIAERNCSLQLLPDDFIYDARMSSRGTLMSEATNDPDAAKKKLILAFGELNIPIGEVEEVIAHSIAACSPAEIVELRQIWSAIRDGNTTWAEVRDSKINENAESIKLEQADEFFRACQASGYSTEETTSFLQSTFKVKDSRKIPTDGFEKAMAFAKTAKNGKPEAKAGEVLSPNKNAPPENTAPAQQTLTALLDRLDQLFDIDGTKPKHRETLKVQYAGRIKELVDKLEADLPQD